MVCCAADRSLALVSTDSQYSKTFSTQDNASADLCDTSSRSTSINISSTPTSAANRSSHRGPSVLGTDLATKPAGTTVAAGGKPTHGAHFGIRLALIIDDDELAQMVVAQILEPLGYKVSSIKDAACIQPSASASKCNYDTVCLVWDSCMDSDLWRLLVESRQSVIHLRMCKLVEACLIDACSSCIHGTTTRAVCMCTSLSDSKKPLPLHQCALQLLMLTANNHVTKRSGGVDRIQPLHNTAWQKQWLQNLLMQLRLGQGKGSHLCLSNAVGSIWRPSAGSTMGPTAELSARYCFHR